MHHQSTAVPGKPPAAASAGGMLACLDEWWNLWTRLRVLVWLIGGNRLPSPACGKARKRTDYHETE